MIDARPVSTPGQTAQQLTRQQAVVRGLSAWRLLNLVRALRLNSPNARRRAVEVYEMLAACHVRLFFESREVSGADEARRLLTDVPLASLRDGRLRLQDQRLALDCAHARRLCPQLIGPEEQLRKEHILQLVQSHEWASVYFCLLFGSLLEHDMLLLRQNRFPAQGLDPSVILGHLRLLQKALAHVTEHSGAKHPVVLVLPLIWADKAPGAAELQGLLRKSRGSLEQFCLDHLVEWSARRTDAELIATSRVLAPGQVAPNVSVMRPAQAAGRTESALRAGRVVVAVYGSDTNSVFTSPTGSQLWPPAVSQLNLRTSYVYNHQLFADSSFEAI